MPMTYVLLVIFIALNIADWFTTSRILALGGSETNKLANYILTRFGMKGMAIYKIAGVFIITAAIFIWPKLWLALLFLIPGYTWVLYNNLKVLKSLKGN